MEVSRLSALITKDQRSQRDKRAEERRNLYDIVIESKFEKETQEALEVFIFLFVCSQLTFSF